MGKSSKARAAFSGKLKQGGGVAVAGGGGVKLKPPQNEKLGFELSATRRASTAWWCTYFMRSRSHPHTRIFLSGVVPSPPPPAAPSRQSILARSAEAQRLLIP